VGSLDETASGRWTAKAIRSTDDQRAAPVHTITAGTSLLEAGKPLSRCRCAHPAGRAVPGVGLLWNSMQVNGWKAAQSAKLVLPTVN
jgi:hypothetical protein